MDVRVDLARIVIQDTSDQQIIFLREREGEREFPIVIGDAEALAIDRRLKGYKRARPMTHDLMSDIIDALGAELEKQPDVVGVYPRLDIPGLFQGSLELLYFFRIQVFHDV